MTLWPHFKDYLSRLSKKWILWLFLLGDSVGIIAGAIEPSIKLPLPAYWGLALVGLLWAGFQVHRDLLKQLPKAEEAHPDLGIDLMEGSEYSYRFSQHPVFAEHAAKAHISIHSRLSNTGNTDLIILSMNAEFQVFEGPWSVDEGKPFHDSQPLLTRPIHLEPGGVLYCDLESEITPDPQKALRFAARLASASISSTPMEVQLRVETVDPSGKIMDFWQNFEIATRPLRELYLRAWQVAKETELLRLAKVIKLDIVTDVAPTRDATDKLAGTNNVQTEDAS